MWRTYGVALTQWRCKHFQKIQKTLQINYLACPGRGNNYLAIWGFQPRLFTGFPSESDSRLTTVSDSLRPRGSPVINDDLGIIINQKNHVTNWTNKSTACAAKPIYKVLTIYNGPTAHVINFTAALQLTPWNKRTTDDHLQTTVYNGPTAHAINSTEEMRRRRRERERERERESK